jgi:branched-chain amino acid transport system substrate-binding protein
MHKKLVLILIPLIFMVAMSAFSGLTFAQPTIKIGIIGPQGLPHWSPGGMWDAAQLAAMEINAEGGINVGGTMHTITLISANEWAIDETGQPNPSRARGEVDRLVSEGAQFIIGVFRTEVAADIVDELYNVLHADIPLFIDGASTDQLINDTVAKNYDMYKYLFRVTPINSTMLFRNICGYLAGYLVPYKLLPMYGHDLDNNPATPNQVRVAVLTEALTWTQTIHTYLSNPLYYPMFLGPYVNVTCALRVPENTGESGGPDPAGYLQNVIGNQSRLMIEVFSGRAGLNIIKKWADMGVEALPVGINVLAQVDAYWGWTGGACEFETVQNFAGTRTPIVGGEGGKTTQFWDHFAGNFSAWPIYTAWGCYDAMYALKEAIEAIDSVDPDTLVPQFESTDRIGLNGRFVYTSGVQPPYTGQPGKGHDVFSVSYGPTWPDGYVRAMFVQWISGGSGVLNVVSPRDQSYSKKTRIPPWMYEIGDWDLNFDGIVDIADIYRCALGFGSMPGQPTWDLEADVNLDGIIDISDIYGIALKFGQTAPEWPLP